VARGRKVSVKAKAKQTGQDATGNEMDCVKCKKLEEEIAWLKYELSLVPASRQRMMRRTHEMMDERDAALDRLKALEERIARQGYVENLNSKYFGDK
jgi:hypothetical protein